MIIEVDEQTGKAVTYKSIAEFCRHHNRELKAHYEKKPKHAVEVNLLNKDIIEHLLPEDSGTVTRIHSHTSFIVVNTDRGNIFSLDRTGEPPFFKLDLKPWQRH